MEDGAEAQQLEDGADAQQLEDGADAQQPEPTAPAPKRRSTSSVALGRLGGEVSERNWSQRRIYFASILQHQGFEVILGILVTISLTLVVMETDYHAEGVEVPVWIDSVEHVLLLIYCIEMASRLYILRLQFFVSALHVLDFTVVVVDAILFFVRLVGGRFPGLTFFRVIRLFRLARAFHILSTEPQLYIMLEGLIATLKTTLFGCVFIFVFMIIYSVLAVEFIRPLKVEFSSTCGRCPYAFNSVYLAMCTLFQTIIVGDEWGVLFLAYMERYPETSLFVVVSFVTISFALINLIFATIVDCAFQARHRNTKEMAEEKEREFQRNQKRLYKLCEEMDEDGSKCITRDEILLGYEDNLEFRRTLKAMDLDKDDLNEVFNILDEDASGEIKYEEFVQQLYKMKSNNSNTMLVFIKHYVTQMKRDINEEMGLMKGNIAGGIQELQEKVGKEMAMIQTCMDDSLRALQQSEIRDHRIHHRIGELHEGVTGVHSSVGELHHKIGKEQELKGSSKVLSASAPEISLPDRIAAATCEESFATDGQLEIVTEKIASAIADLRCKCDDSALLISTLQSILPGTKSDANPCAKDNISSESTNVDSDNICEAKACCHDPSGCADKSSKVVEVEAPILPAPTETPLNSPLHQPDPAAGASTPDAAGDLKPLPALLHQFSPTDRNERDTTANGIPGQPMKLAPAPIDTQYDFVFEEGTGPLGFEIHWVKDELPLVGGVGPDGAASKRGVLAGDRLAACNQHSIAGKDREEVLRFLRLRPLLLTMIRTEGRWIGQS